MTGLKNGNQLGKGEWCSPMKLRIISQREVAQAISMAEAIEAVRKAFIQLSEGRAYVPLRTKIPVPSREGSVLFMPAYLWESEALGSKIVTVFPQNREKNLPTIHAVVMVIDAETGRPQALMEGAYLTALRTGAASGVATDLLSREDVRVVAIFGAGGQSRTQLEAVCAVRSITKVWIYDIEVKKASAFFEEIKDGFEHVPIEFKVANSPSEAVHEADIICAATTSSRPVFDDEDLKVGVHINGIGSYTPEMQEIPGQTVQRAKVVVDSLQASLEEAGDLIIPLNEGRISKSHIHGEIGEVAAGKISGRLSDEELTFFKSVGVAVQDVVVASVVFNRCQELGLGSEVEV